MTLSALCQFYCYAGSENTKGGSITVPLTCLTGLD